MSLIRKTNPRRNLVIGPASWINIHDLDRPEPPEDPLLPAHERHHQRARWNRSTANRSGIAWGANEEAHQVERDFAGLREWSKARRRPILLGEFGTYDRGGADMESRVRYTSHGARTAESLGWA